MVTRTITLILVGQGGRFMRFIPKALLKKLYNRASLRNTSNGVRLSVKNRLAPARLQRIERVALNGRAIELTDIQLQFDGGPPDPGRSASQMNRPPTSRWAPLLTLDLAIEQLDTGEHEIELVFLAEPFGKLEFKVRDTLNTGQRDPAAIPRDSANDYSEAIINERRNFIEQKTGNRLDHIARPSFDPQVTRGNIDIAMPRVGGGSGGPRTAQRKKKKGKHQDVAWCRARPQPEGGSLPPPEGRCCAQGGGVVRWVGGQNTQPGAGFGFGTGGGSEAIRRLAGCPYGRHQAGLPGLRQVREAQARRLLPGQPFRLYPVQFHHRGCGRHEHGRQGDICGLQLDPRQFQVGSKSEIFFSNPTLPPTRRLQ